MARVMHRNIVHTKESANDGILLVADTYHSTSLGGYKEMSIKDIIIESAYRGMWRKLRGDN